MTCLTNVSVRPFMKITLTIMPWLCIRHNKTCHAVKTDTLTSGFVVRWGYCMMLPTTVITLSTLTRRLIPQMHQKTSVSPWPAHTGLTAELNLCCVVSPGEGGGERWLGSVFAAGRVTVEVRGSLFPQLRLSLYRLAFGGWKKGLDEEDSEAPRHLAAGATLPSTSWGPAEPLCGGQKRQTRCTLWSKHRLRGVVQVTSLVRVLPQRSSLWRGEGWRREVCASANLHRTKGF